MKTRNEDFLRGILFAIYQVYFDWDNSDKQRSRAILKISGIDLVKDRDLIDECFGEWADDFVQGMNS